MTTTHAEDPPLTLFDLPSESSPERSTHVRGHVRHRRRPGFWGRMRFLSSRLLGRAIGRTVSLDAVERDRRVFGGAAVVPRTKVPIFFLEDIYRSEGLDAALKAYPQLSEADVFAALSYARVYPEAVRADRRRYLSRAANAH